MSKNKHCWKCTILPKSDDSDSEHIWFYFRIRDIVRNEVARIVCTSYPTARRYIHAYRVYGLAALYDLQIPGRPAQLSTSQLNLIDQWLSDSPRNTGYNQSNWTARLMKYHIKKTWGIKLSGETARRVIHQLGYSLVRPRHNNDHLVDEEEKKKQ